MSLSTHVLDAVRGRPASGLPVRLEQHVGDGWTLLTERVTGPDGRIADLSTGLAAGSYRLVFDTGSYLGPEAFYPEVVVSFRATGAGQHYHVPLLLSPFAYSTYRGS
ncbi:hydroxyisourate hydrolase [Jatrophihabitans sp.]|uniref:hydroxyisourate hydrolase n=1 Tax=Jatrophihabitans sp. TaxID=1932789 RepID=UPI002B918793|nr:hydroxyisourate hydrolase [Jatrophihabitans sp.]